MHMHKSNIKKIKNHHDIEFVKIIIFNEKKIRKIIIQFI